MSNWKPGTAEYDEHVEEEIEHYGAIFKEGEGRQTLQQPIPWSWTQCEQRAAMVVHGKTGAFLNEHVANRLNAKPGSRLLSLGSGPGGMEIEYAKQAPASHIVCMDFNPDLLALGRARAEELQLDMTFVTGDLNTVDLPVGEFDVVYCAASLHHVIELERLAEQIDRTLRPGGALVTVDVVTQNGYLMWPETRAVVNAMWSTLPERYRINHTAYDEARLDAAIWEYDTSMSGMECVRSADILPVLAGAFDIEHFVPYFSVSRRLLDTMYGPNYDRDNWVDRAIVDWIWAMDRHYLDSGTLQPETFFGVYRPRGR